MYSSTPSAFAKHLPRSKIFRTNVQYNELHFLPIILLSCISHSLEVNRLQLFTKPTAFSNREITLCAKCGRKETTFHYEQKKWAPRNQHKRQEAFGPKLFRGGTQLLVTWSVATPTGAGSCISIAALTVALRTIRYSLDL
jgi:hypothetical protein